MEVISNSVDKIVVELSGWRVGTLELLHIIGSGITQESFLFVLSQQAWNLTSGEDHVDELKELFLLDFGVSEDEAAILAEPTSDFEVFLDVLLQVLLRVVLDQLNLLVLHPLDEG